MNVKFQICPSSPSFINKRQCVSYFIIMGWNYSPIGAELAWQRNFWLKIEANKKYRYFLKRTWYNKILASLVSKLQFATLYSYCEVSELPQMIANWCVQDLVSLHILLHQALHLLSSWSEAPFGFQCEQVGELSLLLLWDSCNSPMPAARWIRRLQLVSQSSFMYAKILWSCSYWQGACLDSL